MCVLPVKVPIRKKSGNLFNDHLTVNSSPYCLHLRQNSPFLLNDTRLNKVSFSFVFFNKRLIISRLFLIKKHGCYSGYSYSNTKEIDVLVFSCLNF